MIALARKTLVHEWRRFLPVIVAVGFSGLMLVVQAALVLGIFGTAAMYVDESSADIWAGYPGTQSVNYGRLISADAAMWLRSDPAVSAVEPYLWVDADWTAARAGSGSLSIYLSGIATHDDAMMFARLLPRALRDRLREPGAVIVDSADRETLAVEAGDHAWINGHRVTVVALLPGLRGLGGANVISSLDTARRIGGTPLHQGSTYFVANLRDPSQASLVARRLNRAGTSFGPLRVWTAKEFGSRSRQHWLLETGAGTAVLFMAFIVCLVGAVITNQSFAAVVANSAREYATLMALGVSRRSLAAVVIKQACMVGGLGMVLSAVASTVLLWLAAAYHVPVAMTPTAALGCAVLIALMALLSCLTALRNMVRTDPTLLLR